MRVSSTALVLLAASLLSATPQDQAAYLKAIKDFQRASRRGDLYGTEVADALKAVGDATYPQVDAKTIQLVLPALKKEIAKARRPKEEARVSAVILDGCVRALQKTTHPNAARLLIRNASSPTLDGRYRAYVLLGLAGDKAPEVRGELVKMSGDRDPRVQLAVLEVLASEPDPSLADLFTRIAVDPAKSRAARVVSLEALAGITAPKDPQVVEPLIEALGGLDESREELKAAMAGLLNKLLQLDPPVESVVAEEWKAVWANVKAGKPVAKFAAGGIRPVDFFGRRVRSSRLVILLGASSGYMWSEGMAPFGPPAADQEPEEAKPLNSAERAAQKAAKKIRADYVVRVERLLRAFEAARAAKKSVKEYARPRDYVVTKLMDVVMGLDRRIQFALPLDAKETTRLLPATWVNKFQAVRRLAKAGPQSTGVGFDLGFQVRSGVSRGGKRSGASAGGEGPDTFLYVDLASGSGHSRIGRVLATQTATLAEIRKHNMFRKIRIHTVGVNSYRRMTSGGGGLLGAAARENGGEFTIFDPFR